MNDRILISGARIVNEGQTVTGNVLLENGLIAEIFIDGQDNSGLKELEDAVIFDARGKYLIPGVIDDQVHFREPGLTEKGDLNSESRAAVAGGVTSFMDMPNTLPKAVTIELLEQKYTLASHRSLANCSFFLGATNDNLDELLRADPSKICGIDRK